MEFRILGPLEVRNARGVVALGGIKPRAVLAVLLLHANEPVRAERLALALWGEEAPSGAVRTVQVHVSRLRKALGDAEILETTPGGYRLHVRPGELDAERFELLVDDGRRALAAGQVEHAATVLREALSMWRGTALADVAYEPFAQTEIARLEEQRLAALEARIEADLAAGRHGELLGELQRLLATYPTREHLVGQVMLALYRCGRQAEALEVYMEARRVLIAEIGVEPGPELQRVQEAILSHDVSLELQHAVADLPPELDASTATPLVGRRDEIAWLRLRWERAREGAGGLVTLAGVSGSGKLRLAAELATIAHDGGAAVLYATGRGPADAFLTALQRTRETTRPTLLVVHAADCAGAVEFAELEALSRNLEDLPVLVLACGEDVEELVDLRSDGVLVLDALDAAAVGAIARQYAQGTAVEEVPVDRLLEASGGIPRLVHEVASQWARREAARYVGAVAGRAAAGREELRSIQAELTGSVEDLQEVRERITPRRWEAPVVCPFKGLASFDVADAPYFFGREKLVAELVAQLVGAHLLGIVGPSGSGKSSVMRAGLLPALANGVLPGSETWKQILIRPGEHPLLELTDALGVIGDGERVVVAVDQFEETFTTCEDEAERATFIAELTRMADERHGGCVVMVALRADFYGRCAAYPELAGPLAANHVLVRSMQRDELRRAIELPARRVGLRVDTELADALVADVKDEPGALPLLSTALLELWQRRDGRRLRYTVYEQTGGVRGAVARLAEDAFHKLDDEQQVVARDVLMRLAREGPGGGVERRRVTLAELETDRSEQVASVVALLTDRRLLTVSAGTIELAHEALLREWPRLRDWINDDLDGLRIHRNLNAAACEWEKLGRDEGALYRGVRLTETIEWRDARTPSLNETEREFLHASDARHQLERKQRRRRIALAFGSLTVALVAITVLAVVSIVQGRRTASRELANKSEAVLPANPGLALALALEGLRRSDTEQAQNAVRQATLEYRATQVISSRQGVIFDVALSPDGRFAATAGGGGDDTVRIWSVKSGRLVGETRGYRGDVRAVRFSRDGKRIASAAADGEIVMTDAAGGRRDVIARLKHEDDYATAIDFSADDKTLAIGTVEGRVALVRVGDHAPDYLSSARGAGVFTVDFDSDGHKMVSADEEGGKRIWDVASRRALTLVQPGPSAAGVLAASFSPVGGRVATADVSGVVVIWDAATGRLLEEIKVSDQVLVSVRFSGDGRRIAVGAYDGVVRVLAVPGGAVLAELRQHQGPVRADFVPRSSLLLSAGEDDGIVQTSIPPDTKAATRPGQVPDFRGDGRLVVSGDPLGPVHLWDPGTGKERDLTRHTDESFGQFAPNGSQIVSVSPGGAVLLWDVESRRSRVVPTLTGRPLAAVIDSTGKRIAIGGTTPLVIQPPDGRSRMRLRGHNGRVNALAFSPDSRYLASASDDGTARVWNAGTGKLERPPLRGHDGTVRDVSYSDDGRIATSGNDGTIRIWPADGGDPVILVGHEGAVNTAEFNDDGDRVVSAGDDGTVRIWDSAGGDALVILYRHEGDASGADFGGVNGRTVVSAGGDSMRVTPCEVCGTFAEVLRIARTRAQHKLSAAERQRLLPGS